MEMTRLGRTGLKVSRVCLGTMTFGLQCDEPTSKAIMDVADEGGVNFLDTADGYPLGGNLQTAGRTEEIVGRWLAGKRERFILATKCFSQMGPGPNDRGASRKHVIAAVDASLKRLGTDYIDLLQIHRWDPETPIDETLEALDYVRQTGKIIYAGTSNLAGWQLMHSLWAAEQRHTIRFDCVQPRYNMLFRNIESDLLPAAREFGVGVIPFNPLAGGVLTGKYRPGEKPREGTRFLLGAAGTMYQRRYWHDVQLEIVRELAADVASRGKSLTHVAVRWVIDQPGITSAIIGASKPEQLRDSLKGAEIALDDADRKACDQAWYRIPRRPPAEEM